jgi:purine-nucleoside phosphorylase
MQAIEKRIQGAVEALNGRLGGRRPTVGMVLGSGLGSFAETVQDPVAIPYGEIPGFPTSAVAGHAGRLVVGTVGATPVAVMQGRVHYYEGWDLADVVFPVRVLVRLGCQILVITNAAGGINPGYAAGDLVLLTDHLNYVGTNPLRGPNEESLGPRFPDMSAAYDPALRALALEVGRSQNLDLKLGVYAALSGPSYETPAEIRALRTLGADLVGMSTVPEVIAATHLGARVVGMSCVTNLAAGISPVPLSHEEVKETASRVEKVFVAFMGALAARLGSEVA